MPSNPQSVHTSQTPQKLNGTKDVHFFSVGSLQGRTLVIYMKKKGVRQQYLGGLRSTDRVHSAGQRFPRLRTRGRQDQRENESPCLPEFTSGHPFAKIGVVPRIQGIIDVC